MKKVAAVLTLFCTNLAFAAPDISGPVASVYDRVIVHNANNSVQACNNFKVKLNETKDGAAAEVLDTVFKQLLLAWKKVEASYMAGELDHDYLDTPRFIDVFHNSNEDLSAIMQRQLASSSPPAKALFKNSFKTVNALEAVLYADTQLSARELSFAAVMADSICGHLQDIATVYTDQRHALLADPEKALALYTHALSNSIFTGKEWRIADPAGLSRKYKDQPNAKRSEYALSGHSLAAIKAVFDVHQAMMGQQDYANLADVIKMYQANELAEAINLTLEQIMQQIGQLGQQAFAFQPDLTRPLYDSAGQLYRHYYVSLLSALPIVGKILEADGD